MTWTPSTFQENTNTPSGQGFSPSTFQQQDNSWGGKLGGGLLGGAVNFLTGGIQDFTKNYGQNIQQVQQQFPQMVNDFQKNPAQAYGQQLTGEAQNAVKMAPSELGAASDIYGMMQAPKMIKGAWNVAKDLPAYMTKKGTAGLTTKAVQEFGDQGGQLSWKDITDLAKEGKLNSDLVKQIDEVGAKYAPDVKDAAQMIDPERALAIRKEISKLYGPSIFDYFTGNSMEKQGASSLRNAISQIIHEEIPKTVTPDKMYSTYTKLNKFGLGSPAEMTRNYAIFKVLKPIIGKELAGLLHVATGGQ